MCKYLFLSFFFFSQVSLAQNIATDSVAFKQITKYSTQLNQLTHYHLLEKEKLKQQPLSTLNAVLPIYNPSHRLYINHKIMAPALLIGFGFLTLGNPEFLESNEAVQHEITGHYPGFQTDLDDYTRYVPVAAVYGLNLAGVRGKHNFLDLSMLYALSSIINNTITKNIKHFTGSQRPDAFSYDTFPSGHTSTAFANAELMHQEYRYASGWYSVGGYSCAVATGSLRMLNNRHWLSDVVAGAGVGILSTRLAYILYPWLKEKLKLGQLGGGKIVAAPMYQESSYGLNLGFKVDPKPHQKYFTQTLSKR